MRRGRRAFLAAALGASGLARSRAAPRRPRAPAPAAQDWKKEFEEICAKTQDAMALPLEELKASSPAATG